MFNKKRSLEMLLGESRSLFFRDALEYINFEKVPGDILEFGVYTGKTLATFTYLNQLRPDLKFSDRRVVGFDWFKGLKGGTEKHPRWSDDSCTINKDPTNPVANIATPVTPELVSNLFKYFELDKPLLEIGDYKEILPSIIGIDKKYNSVALVHIDCDLYEPTIAILKSIEPILQDGTMILFDDWFHYKANIQKGEARAFYEWLESVGGKWKAVHYRTYGIFCNSFILSKS